MKIIMASYIVHRDEKRIKLQFDVDTVLNNYVKKITGIRYSKTMKCWHIPCKKNIYLHFKNNFPVGWKVVETSVTKTAITAKEKLLQKVQ